MMTDAITAGRDAWTAIHDATTFEAWKDFGG